MKYYKLSAICVVTLQQCCYSFGNEAWNVFWNQWNWTWPTNFYLGDLITDPQNIAAGGFYEFDPLVAYPNSIQYQLDQQAKQDCCIDSNNCGAYRQLRQVDDCSRYRPPRISKCQL